MSETIKITADRYSLTPDEIEGGTSGSFGDVKLKFEFSDDWDGLNKKVVFHPQRGPAVEVLVFDSTGEVDLPPEATAISGVTHFVVNGYITEDGETLTKNIISLPGRINVKPTYKTKGTNTRAVTVDNFTQLLNSVKGEMELSLSNALASGEFNGEDGQTPYIGTNGNWYIGSIDTGVSARGTKGDQGIQGEKGDSPYIGSNGNWFVGETDLGYPARGENGADGKDGTNGTDGKDGESGVYVSETDAETPPDNANVWVVVPNDGSGQYVLVPDGMRCVDGRLQLKCGDEVIGDPVIVTSGSGTGGADGTTFTPSVSEDGIISWTNDGGKDNPTPVNIKGADGANGTNGENGVGIQSVVQTTTSTVDGGDNVITVTLTNGNTSTFTVKNGSQGSAGSGSGTDIIVDSALSETSENPVQNKVITAELNKKIESVELATNKDVGGVLADTATDDDIQPVRIGTDGKLYTQSGAAIVVDSAMSATSTNPVQNKVIKSYVDTSVSTCAAKSTKVTTNISTTWTGTAAPYTQSISIASVTADSIVDVSLASTATDEQAKAYMALMLQDGGQAAKSITLKAYGTKNTVAIPINIVVRGG